MYTVYFLTVVFALIITGKIIQIQFVQGEEWRRISKERNFRFSDINAIRGNIVSADGKRLILSKPVYDVFMDPCADNLVRDSVLFFNNIKPLGDSLQKHFGMNSAKFVADMKAIRKKGSKKTRSYLIKKSIDLEQKELMSTFPIFNKGRIKGGFVVSERYVTDYPYGTLAKRTLGIAENKKYGLNWCYDKELSGTVGKQYEQRMKGGEWLPVNSDSVKRIEPQNGYDVVTTIDFGIQDFAETELANKLKLHNANWGCIVLMEVVTGEIKAIANLAYDTATQTISEDDNYAVAHLIEPGSTFKLATLMTAFEDGYITIDDVVDCEGGKITMYGTDFTDSRKWGYGKINIRDIFKESSNIGVVKVVEEFYNSRKEGETQEERNRKRQKFVQGLKDMRLDKTVQTEIENEPSPRIARSRLSHISLLKMAYGYEMQMTPLQILTFYNAVANGGKMVKPMFVNEIREGNRTIKKIEPTVLKESIASEKTIAFAREILEAVVSEGTAKSINDTTFYTIAGKTGTAKINHPIEGYKHSSYYISTFAGYFPADNPKYSCIVVIHEPKKSGYYGAVVSAPVFKAISDKVYSSEIAVFTEEDIAYAPDNMPPFVKGEQNDLEVICQNLGINIISENPDAAWSEVSVNDKIVEMKTLNYQGIALPDLTDMSFKDAVYLIENKGLKVSFTGYGRVKSQIPDAGTEMKKGETVKINLSL